MDSVRFGRILGKGARAAAKGLYEAVDAAAAPNPNPPKAACQPRAVAPKKAVTREARKLGKSFLTPFARAGSVLWLEVTGTFFAVFAAIFLGYAWRYRAAVRLSGTDADAHRHLLASTAAAAVFGYFAVTSFMRARRRERARG
jgi:hypothetical protein